ncbi:MaoC family dehydratase [Chelatococcus reniformis]|uniref:FAS1-like dehydratase domain-containing protein n=1 Tax=Chelatococcus reniformis TaxID=1494448 RepID=A0A916U185_9HYPH|nr:MaoC family dehydratase N-terminal domain-containing protein [Chelatococcus reniformis]GGC54176.1 hypothetical protein GCM10010994_11400 [Chelatococcus reniformis]
MRIIGEGFRFEDFTPGDEFRTVARTITETDLVNFITCVGMLEALFIDAEYRASKAATSGRLVPAALVYAMAEGLVLNATAQATGLAFLHTELNVLKPTVAGDTIHVEVEVISAEPASRSGRGKVRTMNRVVNQRGEVVIEYNPLRLVAGRGA